jgi:DNA-binding MarR family transcriptional regulator
MVSHELTTDWKIVESMERISRIFKILLWDMAKRIGLSPLQTQILLYVQANPEGMGGVSRVAAEFGLTQATISDAVNTLIEKGFLERRPGAEDRRLKLLRPTLRGRRLAERASVWMNTFHDKILTFAWDEQEDTLAFLLRLIRKFQENGVHAEMHLCCGCRNFRMGAAQGRETDYTCGLTETTVPLNEAKFNCPHWRSRLSRLPSRRA